MRIAFGKYKGETAGELIERDPGYAEWFWQHAARVRMQLRQEVRAVLAESRLARLSDQFDRLAEYTEGLKRQHARDRIRVPSTEETNFEKVRADRLQRQLAAVLQTMADKDRDMDTLKELFKKLRPSMLAWYAHPAAVPEDDQERNPAVLGAKLQQRMHRLLKGSTSGSGQPWKIGQIVCGGDPFRKTGN